MSDDKARTPDKEAPLKRYWVGTYGSMNCENAFESGDWVRADEAQARIEKLEREIKGWQKQFSDQVHRKRETRRILEARASDKDAEIAWLKADIAALEHTIQNVNRRREIEVRASESIPRSRVEKLARGYEEIWANTAAPNIFFYGAERERGYRACLQAVSKDIRSLLDEEPEGEK